MEDNRCSSKRAPPSGKGRRSNHIGRSRPLAAQSKLKGEAVHIHRRGRGRVQPLAIQSYAASSEASELGYLSQQSTHPSAEYAYPSSGQSSGYTCQLASARRLSFQTPPTPTSSRDEDVVSFVEEDVPVGERSPFDSEIVLQGINGNSNAAEDYGFPYTTEISSDLRFEGSYEVGKAQWDQSHWISTPIPANLTQQRGPWNGYTLNHIGQSHPSDVVEEGPGFYRDHSISLGEWGPIGQQWHVPFAGSNRPLAGTENPINGTPGSGSFVSTDSSTGPTPFRTPKCGRRVGGLTKFGRENAKDRRENGSCSRCFYMKEQCVMESDGVCRKCRQLANKYRSWNLPCSVDGLDKRAKYLLPDVLVAQLQPSQIKAFIGDHVDGLVQGSSINLSLMMGSGSPLRLNAVEVVPRGSEAIRMRGFRLADDGSTESTILDSPPILPFMASRRSIMNDVSHWADCIIRDQDSDFPEDCFPEPHEQWPREMLTIILQYHQSHIGDLEEWGHGPYQTLRWALKMTVFNHIMSHALVVPEDEVEHLAGQLQRYRLNKAAEWICPRIANRVIKFMVLPMLEAAANRVMCDLAKMLRARPDDNLIWDQAFCITFLCLIVAGKTQASLAERAEAGEADASFPVENAKAEICRLEDEVSTHLITMFHQRFGTRKKGNGKAKAFNPLARHPAGQPPGFVSRLAELVRSTSSAFPDEHKAAPLDDDIEDQVSSTTDLQHADLKTMKKKNVMRLLQKFMGVFR